MLHPFAFTRGAYEFKELGRKSADAPSWERRDGEVVTFEQTGGILGGSERGSDVNQE
jgi:hypothetical protein